MCECHFGGRRRQCLEFGPHVPLPAPDRWIISVSFLKPVNGVSVPPGGMLQKVARMS